MNFFDASIIHFFNQFSRHSGKFDYLVDVLSRNNFVKGGVLMVLLWWLWFRVEEERHPYREHVLATLASCIVGLSVARVLALTLPFRLRPIHDPSVHFQVPNMANPAVLDQWSAFPSDHATLFFALATGIWCASRSLGLLTFVYIILMICLPRIYLGLHYPTDILAGGVIGIGFGALANIDRVRGRLVKPAMLWLRKLPAFFLLYVADCGNVR